MRLFIIGFKSSGKTTFGHALADELGSEFIDTDEYIEDKYGLSIPELYARDGEDSFRRKEWKVLQEIVTIDNIVVSTGGGLACHCDNMNLIEKYGDAVYLKVDNDTLVYRLKVIAPFRPVIKGKTTEELYRHIESLKERCEHHYLRARYILEGKDISVKHLMELMQNDPCKA